jgi:hypothetical protein
MAGLPGLGSTKSMSKQKPLRLVGAEKARQPDAGLLGVRKARERNPRGLRAGGAGSAG